MGENGFEFEYCNCGGYIVYNCVLQNMVVMFGIVVCNVVNVNWMLSWLKGVVLVFGIVVSVVILVVVEDVVDVIDMSVVINGVQYFNLQNFGLCLIDVLILVSMIFMGKVDCEVMFDICVMKEELFEELQDLLEDSGCVV